MILKPRSDYYASTHKCKVCTLAHIACKRIPKTRTLSTRRASVYKRGRRALDPMFKLRSNMGTLIANSLTNSGYIKESSTASILGCSFEEFYNYIESQFTLGMNWTNRDLWHIDHIVPVSFAHSESELILLNHYTNLRPVWATDNLSKGNRIVDIVVEHPVYKQIISTRNKV